MDLGSADDTIFTAQLHSQYLPWAKLRQIPRKENRGTHDKKSVESHRIARKSRCRGKPTAKNVDNAVVKAFPTLSKVLKFKVFLSDVIFRTCTTMTRPWNGGLPRPESRDATSVFCVDEHVSPRDL